MESWSKALLRWLCWPMFSSLSVAWSVEPSTEIFAQAPRMDMPSLSPDGAHLAFIAQSDERQSVILRRLDNGRDRGTLVLEPQHERVRWCRWADDRILLCGTVVPRRAPQGILEHTRLYAIEQESGRVTPLNGRMTDPRQDQLVDITATRTGRVLIQHDDVGRGYPAVSELDLESRTLRRVVNDRPPVRRWLADGRGNVALGLGYERGIASLHVRSSEEDWTTIGEFALDDPGAVGPLGFGETDQQLYVLSDYQGRTALFELDPRAYTSPRLLFAHPRYDVAGPIVLDPRSRALLAVRYVGDTEQTHFFDAGEQSRQSWLDSALPGTVNVIADRTADGQRVLVLAASDMDAPSYYLGDVTSRRLSLLGHQYPELEEVTLARMTSTSYLARDGQVIPAYLTLPPGPARSGLPAVVLPHGGPESRDYRRFDPMVQFLAARGYAVLQMNYRGSLGYGARFAAAGTAQWGGIIHNDITDGARWLIEQGIADPARICIVGASFGGYAAMLAASRESAWYACAASYAGISDLMAIAREGGKLPGAEILRQRVGDDTRSLWQMSPISRARTVEIPILLVHGRQDAVVPLRQSTQFARVLRANGKPVTLEQRSDCDHDMTVESCRLFYFKQLEVFLAEHLH